MPGKTLGVKLDAQLQALVLSKCQSMGCSPSAYLRELIQGDLSGVAKVPETGVWWFKDGKRFKYCTKCKKFVGKDENGKEIFL